MVVEHSVAELHIRLLALQIDPSGDETYCVSVRRSLAEPLIPGVLTHAHADQWDVVAKGTTDPVRVTWTCPDDLFALASGHDVRDARSCVTQAAPHWPSSVTERLAARRLSGPGTLAFDGPWFLAMLATSPLDRPIVLLDGTSVLGLTGLERATAILAAVAARAASEAASMSRSGLAYVLARAVAAERSAEGGRAWAGDGRLIGECPFDELSQLGTDVEDGCRAALGAGPLRVSFADGVPLGLGLGPLRPSDNPDSAGAGCVVGEVDVGEAGSKAGVTVGMALSHLSNPHLDLPSCGPDAVSFEAVLEAIDARRLQGGPLSITFDTAASVTHLYAVEMPAAAALHALAAAVDEDPPLLSDDVGVGASLDALCGPTLIWREDTPRLFVGEAGSVTGAHTDICPQVQMAHGLVGTKLLGVASHEATQRLSTEHVEYETTVHTDRALSASAARLLCDPDVSVAVLFAGDLAVFDSGALHFASAGTEAISGALYHGLITPGAVPRLRLAASRAGGKAPSDGAFSGHLFAFELLRLVERQLAKRR